MRRWQPATSGIRKQGRGNSSKVNPFIAFDGSTFVRHIFLSLPAVGISRYVGWQPGRNPAGQLSRGAAAAAAAASRFLRPFFRGYHSVCVFLFNCVAWTESRLMPSREKTVGYNALRATQPISIESIRRSRSRFSTFNEAGQICCGRDNDIAPFICSGREWKKSGWAAVGNNAG